MLAYFKPDCIPLNFANVSIPIFDLGKEKGLISFLYTLKAFCLILIVFEISINIWIKFILINQLELQGTSKLYICLIVFLKLGLDAVITALCTIP